MFDIEGQHAGHFEALTLDLDAGGLRPVQDVQAGGDEAVLVEKNPEPTWVSAPSSSAWMSTTDEAKRSTTSAAVIGVDGWLRLLRDHRAGQGQDAR